MVDGSRPAVVTCALTGVLTDPAKFGVPVTPEQMARAAKEAFDAGATIVHCHFRDQREGLGHLPTWDPEVVADIVDAIRAAEPRLLINMSTGTFGSDISAQLACLRRSKPEIAALNAGSLNYLKTTKEGSWAWPPMLFDNPVDKVTEFARAMMDLGIVPECECFDTGIVRSVRMYEQVGIVRRPYNVSFVMGVASGMPAKPEWLPLLVEEAPAGAPWQVIAIGREEIWPVLRRAAELGGDVRTGLEDTFYLPDGSRAKSNGPLIEALVKTVRESGREVATPDQARKRLARAI
ncbi:MAG: 3-keto-5-aminohexanoate cleavage protein [Deltaproteobacteria bacterium]|nr:3-keto-5-aminohexanoate cleavage protein [Deltaproteobacteria bacterium]